MNASAYPNRVVRTALSGRFLLASLVLLAVGCGDYGGSSTDTSLAQANLSAGIPEGLSVADQVTTFQTTVFPIVRANCAGCHDAGGPGSPKIAHIDVSTAWAQVVDNQKVNFSSPSSSRLVRRLAADLHFCWTSCAADAATMTQAIQDWKDAIDAIGGSTGGVDVANLTSNTRTTLDGFEEVGSDRYDAGIIARWDFKELTGNTAFDTSGVAPPIDLTLEGDAALMSNYGIDIPSGRAIGTPEASSKLFTRIASQDTGTQAYTLEMWISNANITQDGPARIFTYSSGNNTRNMMLGQVAYQYVMRNRSFRAETNNNGSPDMETYAVDQDAQATLQHVVVVYDQIAGRRIYVNGSWTEDMDMVPPGRLWNWSPTERVIIGNERSNNRQWIGKVRFAAVYDRPLDDSQIRRNYEAGVGKRVTVAFDVSQWTGGSSVIEFSLTQLDDYSYLLCQPTFVTNVNSSIRVQGMRISLNGVIPVSGQSFTNMNAYVSNGQRLLSRQCSVIGGLVDPDTDVFQLSFDYLGLFQDPVAAIPPPTPGAEDFGDPVPTMGIRSFGRVNATMANVTGVDPLTPDVADVFEELTQQLPSTPDLRSFVSANQVGVAKLGVEYCEALVEDASPGGLRETFFPGAASFAWDQPPATAFATPADVDLITDPLLDQVIGAGLRGDVGGSPARGQVEAFLDTLVGNLASNCGGAGEPVCDGAYTRNMVKGVCTAAVSSGAVHVH